MANEKGVGTYKARHQQKLLPVDYKVFIKYGTGCKREYPLVDGFKASRKEGQLQCKITNLQLEYCRSCLRSLKLNFLSYDSRVMQP
ncbi:hypothetical protein OS493_019779 [Desmophyllum pertusum]|uniref:Uncharacterized protein n=1 Tax=Desmophyllum pertusum TaxID=174260 RepID=A0A9W9Z0Z2_9CNID|nr:hypothetical protein OS493_019779 [Desmophyllum pertusum]